ncbi:DUF4112 domain-containing protein [Mucilaginibacter terrae]|uniref:DUF4112 domain-containing protein n=1 Tax=Mucilaginibacter terrae TaxID=1955052 RepID=A0ABU3GV68_9SPHI|nr:DUF4112 domain-containing protein [Mucilaginibacter terrae]MDT3403665.1 hypothetical protein [Mucilaginibacter terrae]
MPNSPQKYTPPINLTGRLKWVERIARLFDEQFKVPGTNFRFGLDPIINLFPVVGDAAGIMVSAALILTMAQKGVSRKVLILMVLNVFVDGLIGAIPIIGQIFDFYFKANSRNIKLLKEHYDEGKHQGSGTGILIFVSILLLLGAVLFVYLSYKLVAFLISLF